jgi:hypothetical protein
VAVLLNRGGGRFDAPRRYPVDRGPHILALEDLNGDGLPDLIVGTLGSHRLNLLLGRADGGFDVGDRLGVGRFPHYMAFLDWNGDGKKDIAVVVAGDDGVDLLAGDGKGRFTRAPRLAAGVNPHGLVVADLNLDRIPDLVVSNRSSRDLSIFLGTGQGFAPARAIFTDQDIIAIGVADFDRDGKADLALVSASHHAVVVLRGDGAGGFAPIGAREGVGR